MDISTDRSAAAPAQSALLAPPEPRAAKARVLHLINGQHYAGAEKVQDLLALRLSEHGYDVAFACVKPEKFAELRLSQEAPLYEVPMRSRFDFAAARRLAKLIENEGYDLLHTHTARTVLVGAPAARRAGVPLVHHMHTQTSTEVVGRWLCWINAGAERVSLRAAAGIVAVSPTLVRYLRRLRVPEESITLVPNGVPSPGPLPRRDPPDDVWTLGTVAMFRPRKGLEVLLDAVGRLRGSGLPVALRVVGGFETEEYEQSVRRHVERLGLGEAVEFVGFQRDVAAQLAHIDICVLPSLVPEGMPMAVLESMASGAVAAGSDVDGIRDVIRHGETGLLFAPGDAGDLASCLGGIIRRPDEWLRLRRDAYQEHARRYSDHAMARGVSALYDRILFPTREKQAT